MDARVLRHKKGQPVRLEEQTLDTIRDPVQLAHALTDLEPVKESIEYQGRLRGSSMYSVCVRERLLGIRLAPLKYQYISRDLQLIFKKGTFYHDLVQNTRAVFGNNRLGWWECLACGRTRFGRPPTKNCTSCGARKEAIHYKEHAIFLDTPYLASAHIDLFLEVSPGDIRILDVKSLDIDEMVRLTAPKPENAYQVRVYMELIQHDKTLPVSINTSSGLLLYFAKRGRRGVFPMKMFHVPACIMASAAIREDLAQFGRGMQDPSYLPDPKGVCVDSDWAASKPKWCPMKVECREAFI